MDSIDRLAGLWDRRRVLCLCTGAILLGAWGGAHRWLPDGFGAEQFQRTSAIPIVGPVSWNARLRFIAGEKEQYLGSMPQDPDAGELHCPDPDFHYYASFSGGTVRWVFSTFSGGTARLGFSFGTFGDHEGIVGAGNSPILALAGPQMNWLASGAEDGSIVIWQVLSSRNAVGLKPLATLGTPRPVTALALSEDAKVLASGSSDGVIRLWDLSAKPRLLREIQDQKQTVYALAFSRDKPELWSGGFDGVLRARRVDGDGPAMEKERRDAPIYSLHSSRYGIDDFGYYSDGSHGVGPGSRVRDRLPMYSGTARDWTGGISSGPRRASLSPDRSGERAEPRGLPDRNSGQYRRIA